MAGTIDNKRGGKRKKDIKKKRILNAFEKTTKFVCLHNGRGDRNRTRISGFGDRYTAFVLHPYDC